MKTSKVGITALVPPEIIYGCGYVPCDVNNFVPYVAFQPKNKVCAWTACWRELILQKKIRIKKLVVVAGGDCQNALTDGQIVSLSGIPTHFFSYPFNCSVDALKNELILLKNFFGGKINKEYFKKIKKVKNLALKIEREIINERIPYPLAFKYLIALSDLMGNIKKIEFCLKNIKRTDFEVKARIGYIGVPPINFDFHKVAFDLGLHVVYDEMPHEFARLDGENISELARSYSTYTFSIPLIKRINMLAKNIDERKVDGIIHYTQVSCHHNLEDEILRSAFNYPIVTIQADEPCTTPAQTKLRLEAFAEMIGKR
ncbi:MAG: 2-hydroxyacyl-CoA dehydratase family protein [Candidatus Thermoplasmatota archaeon]